MNTAWEKLLLLFVLNSFRIFPGAQSLRNHRRRRYPGAAGIRECNHQRQQPPAHFTDIDGHFATRNRGPHNAGHQLCRVQND